jgi:hypothetical protein
MRYPRRCKFEGGGIVVCTSVVSRCQAPHLSDAIEEAFYLIALTVDPSTETEYLFAVGLCGDVGSTLALFGKVTNGIGVIGLVGKDCCSRLDVAQQLFSHWGISSLTCG